MDAFQTKFNIFWPNTSQILVKHPIFLKCKSHHLAILITIWRIWEDISKKVNMNEPGLRFFHIHFWPVISQAVRKPCFSAWIPRGPNPGFPDAAASAGAGAGRILKSRSRPLPTHPGMKYFREETLAVDFRLCLSHHGTIAVKWCQKGSKGFSPY